MLHTALHLLTLVLTAMSVHGEPQECDSTGCEQAFNLLQVKLSMQQATTETLQSVPGKAAQSMVADVWGNLEKGHIVTFAGTNGVPGADGDGGPATLAHIGELGCVRLDMANEDGLPDVYTCDQTYHNVRKVDHRTNTITTVVGKLDTECGTAPGFFDVPGGIWLAECDVAGDGGDARNAHFRWMHHFEIDRVTKAMYIVDSLGHAIRYVDPVSNTISTVVGTYNVSGYEGDGGPANQAKMSLPHDVVMDQKTKDLYIADQMNNAIRKVDGSTGIISTFVKEGAVDITLVDRDDGKPDVLYAGVDGTIRRIDGMNGTISILAGRPGHTDTHSGDGGPATSAELFQPSGITLDRITGDMYIASCGDQTIRRIDGTTKIITTIAGTSGVSGNSGDGGPAKDALLGCPAMTDIDPIRKRLYIEDADNKAVRMIQL